MHTVTDTYMQCLSIDTLSCFVGWFARNSLSNIFVTMFYVIFHIIVLFISFVSVRWKILLGFNCRNRLLLTGTPIQNTMAEVRFIIVFLYKYRLGGNAQCII